MDFQELHFAQMNIAHREAVKSLSGFPSRIAYHSDTVLIAIAFNYRYRFVLPEEVVSFTERDLWEYWQHISHYRCRFSLEFR